MDKIELKLTLTKDQFRLLYSCVSRCRNDTDSPMVRELFGKTDALKAWAECNTLFGEIMKAAATINEPPPPPPPKVEPSLESLVDQIHLIDQAVKSLKCARMSIQASHPKLYEEMIAPIREGMGVRSGQKPEDAAAAAVG